MNLDNNFTKLIQDWLAANPSERDYSVGALYLLKLSGNKIMYQNLVSRDNSQSREFIEYQLNKYLNFRLAALTHAEVEEMAVQVEKIVAEHIPLAADQSRKPNAVTSSLGNAEAQPIDGRSQPDTAPARGKRADHDSLPDNIKALYVENLSLLQKMRELHLKLRSLSTVNVTCPDSERYPFLKELIRLDKKLHSNWEQYDHYIASDEKNSSNKRHTRAARSKG